MSGKPVLYIPHGNHYLIVHPLAIRYIGILMFFLKRACVYLMSHAERLRYRDNGIRVAGSEVRNYVERRESDVSLARVLSSQVIRLLGRICVTRIKTYLALYS